MFLYIYTYTLYIYIYLNGKVIIYVCYKFILNKTDGLIPTRHNVIKLI